MSDKKPTKKELKLLISELTHNWGLERNMLVKQIAVLSSQRDDYRKVLTINDESVRLRLVAAESEIRRLEKWFHGYRTPEMSMLAMSNKIAELKAQIKSLKKDD